MIQGRKRKRKKSYFVKRLKEVVAFVTGMVMFVSEGMCKRDLWLGYHPVYLDCVLEQGFESGDDVVLGSSSYYPKWRLDSSIPKERGRNWMY